MKQSIRNAIFLSALLIAAGLVGGCNRAKHAESVIGSVETDLSARSCKALIDPDDPNDTPYRRCSGVSGYTLIVRRVGSGRQSIEVATPEQKIFPLDYQEVITRHMFHLDKKAEWRVLRKQGRKIPIALIVRIHAQENPDEPEQVTHAYLAVAKITPDVVCVTDRLLDGALSLEQARNAADSAQDKPCLEPQPPMNSR